MSTCQKSCSACSCAGRGGTDGLHGPFELQEPAILKYTDDPRQHSMNGSSYIGIPFINYLVSVYFILLLC